MLRFRHLVLAALTTLLAVAANTPAADISLRAVDLTGVVHGIGLPSTRPTALVFLGTDCPISRRYLPVLNDLLAQTAQKNIQLFGVISDPTVSFAAAQKYRDDYAVAFPILFDASGEIAKTLHPLVTPDAFVIDRAGSITYHGRIDDNYVSFARQKQQIERHDFADAITAAAANQPITLQNIPAVGCAFEAWDQHGASSKITYNRNIAPILTANCASCHHSGEVAPFPLTSYQDAAKHAKQIAAVTENHFMPPWKADPNYGHFSYERRLSDDQIATLSAWAESGAPEGDPADLPPAPTFQSGWRLGKPDVVLSMPKEFHVPAGGDDIYRCFVLPLDLPDDMYVSGMQFAAGAPSVVHHCLLYLDNTGQGRRRQAASTDPQPGYTSFGGIGFAPSGMLGGWAPGFIPNLLPDGVGRSLPKHSDVVMQIHYHPDGRPHADQSSVAIYFAKKKITQVVGGIPLLTRRIDIPPGQAHYVRKKSVKLPMGITLVGLTPHMHLLGRQMKLTATLPNGIVIPLISITDWDFRWQDQYRLASQINLPAGTRIDMEAVYDNSDANPANPSHPPKRVQYGEQTTDEMCLCFLGIIADSPLQLRQIIVATALAERVQ